LTSSEAEVHELQATLTGAVTARTIEFKGQRFRIADKIGLMPLMRFAHAASQDLDTDDLEGLAAVYTMLRDCIHPGTPACGGCGACATDPTSCPSYDPGDWRKFEAWATETKADGEELLPVVGQVIEILTARPTKGPSGSSARPARTSRKSTGTSSAPPVGVSNGSRPGR
jgi:hypothetical protein